MPLKQHVFVTHAMNKLTFPQQREVSRIFTADIQLNYTAERSDIITKKSQVSSLSPFSQGSVEWTSPCHRWYPHAALLKHRNAVTID